MEHCRQEGGSAVKHNRRQYNWTVDFCICAAAYICLDLPFRAMGFLGLTPLAGPKNAVPVAAGIMCGVWGAAGSAAGAVISAGLWVMRAGGDVAVSACGGILTTALAEVLAEALAVWIVSVGFYLAWYLPAIISAPEIKHGRNAVKYAGLCLAAGIAAGIIEELCARQAFDLEPGAIFFQTGISTFVWSLLLGLPVLITLTSVFAVSPAIPKRVKRPGLFNREPDLTVTAGRGVEETGRVSDILEEYNQNQKIPPKRAYAILSCVEELGVMIQEHLPEGGQMEFNIKTGDTVVIGIRYPGERYNPLAVRPVSGGPAANLDILGILMVREMAVTTRYRRDGEMNELKIVV